MKNQEILDDEQLNNGKEVIDKRTQKPYRRALIYLVIMLFATYALVYLKYKNMLFDHDFSFYISMSIGIIIFCFGISFVLEFFRFLIRKFKSKKVNTITLIDPFWFQIIEGAFAIWILYAITKIAQIILIYEVI